MNASTGHLNTHLVFYDGGYTEYAPDYSHLFQGPVFPQQLSLFSRHPFTGMVRGGFQVDLAHKRGMTLIGEMVPVTRMWAAKLLELCELGCIVHFDSSCPITNEHVRFLPKLWSGKGAVGPRELFVHTDIPLHPNETDYLLEHRERDALYYRYFYFMDRLEPVRGLQVFPRAYGELPSLMQLDQIITWTRLKVGQLRDHLFRLEQSKKDSPFTSDLARAAWHLALKHIRVQPSAPPGEMPPTVHKDYQDEVARLCDSSSWFTADMKLQTYHRDDYVPTSTQVLELNPDVLEKADWFSVFGHSM
jgi:hypothetical protein